MNGGSYREVEYIFRTVTDSFLLREVLRRKYFWL